MAHLHATWDRHLVAPWRETAIRCYSGAMPERRSATLYLVCGKIAAGKSTLTRQLAERPATLLIALDDWMSTLYPTEVRTIEDFSRLTTRLREVMGPHIVTILRNNVSVALDFPANTVKWRDWMRTIFTAADAPHELHVLDPSDAVCKERLRLRNASGTHQYQIDEATYDLFTSYFVLPAPEEGFNTIFHGGKKQG